MKFYEKVEASKWVDGSGFSCSTTIHSEPYEGDKDSIYNGYGWSDCWFMEDEEQPDDGDVKYEATFYPCDDDGDPNFDNPLVRYTIWLSDYLEGNTDGTTEVLKRN